MTSSKFDQHGPDDTGLGTVLYLKYGPRGRQDDDASIKESIPSRIKCADSDNTREKAQHVANFMTISSAIASSSEASKDDPVSSVELERLQQSPELLSDLREYVAGQLSLADLLARLR